MGDSMKDVVPPPVGGLGNFKGVMLCNRPVDADSSMKAGGDGTGPFRSMISATCSEQLGLTPCKNFEPTVKTRGPSAALRRHLRWLKELQEQMKGEREEVEEEEERSDEKKRKMKEFFHQQREGVREMLEKRNAERDGVVAKPDPAKKKAQAPSKPLWAMTAQEKDDFEEEEADSLINFAEGLDYDKYVGDLQFRQGLDALRDRTGKLMKEQEMFKDALIKDFNAQAEADERSTSVGSPRNLEDGVDGQSILGDLRSEYSCGSRRSNRGDERYGREKGRDWDGSTNCGDEHGPVDYETKDIAERVLESAPQIRQVHSKESMQRVVERARAKEVQHYEPHDLVDAMRRDGPAPVPVIVASSDTQNRLHKPADPSLLPYLYRSPAI